MYAVIETGGKQYRVELGSEIAVERLDADPGATIDLDRVLLVADGDTASIGTPLVSDATVTVSVVRQDRGEKITVFKYRPKARHRSKRGHRQEQTIIRVADIRLGTRSAADEAKVEEKQASKARATAAAEAEKKAAADQALAAKLAADEAAKAKAAAKTTKATETKPAAKAKAEPKTKAKNETKAATKGKSESTPKAEPKAKAAPAPKANAPKPTKPAAKKSTATKPAAKKEKD